MTTDFTLFLQRKGKKIERYLRKPERQHDLESMTSILQDHFKVNHIFEIRFEMGYQAEKMQKQQA